MRETKRPRRRLRRNPEEARALILDATQRLLAERGPDAIALTEVAKEVGVSHGLITHYFGTRDALVEAALERVIGAEREALLQRIANDGSGDPRKWIEAYLEDFRFTDRSRLVAWAVLAGRVGAHDFFPSRTRGLQLVADAIQRRLDDLGRGPVDRQDLEFVLILLGCAPYGFAVGRDLWYRALGREPDEQDDSWFFERLAKLIATLIPEPT